MRTLKLKAQADSDGVVRLEIPTGFSNHDLEIVVAMSPIQPEPTDAMGLGSLSHNTSATQAR